MFTLYRWLDKEKEGSLVLYIHTCFLHSHKFHMYATTPCLPETSVCLLINHYLRTAYKIIVVAWDWCLQSYGAAAVFTVILCVLGEYKLLIMFPLGGPWPPSCSNHFRKLKISIISQHWNGADSLNISPQTTIPLLMMIWRRKISRNISVLARCWNLS